MRAYVPLTLLLFTLAGCHGVDTHRIDKPFNRLSAEAEAAKGDPESVYQVGLAFLEGRDGAKNYRMGTKWVCHAALKGHTPAYMSLGHFYSQLGKTYPLPPSSDNLPGTKAYDIIAYAWYSIAERNGVVGARAARLNVMQYLSQEATEKAIVLADAYPNTPCEFEPELWQQEDIFFKRFGDFS